MNRRTHAFTLVEILIVVVILGILSAIVVPQFSNATSQAQQSAISDQTAKLRQVLAVYYVRNGNVYPTVTAGDGTWGQLLAPSSTYLRQVPVNPWVGGAAGRQIIIRNSADTAYQNTYGWIFNPATGDLWAGGCDAQDKPFPRP